MSFIKCLIGKLIEKLETIELKSISSTFDEDDVSRKIIDEHDIDCYVRSDKGFVHTSKIYRTQPYSVYEITLTDGKKLECADNHILFTGAMTQILARNLRPSMYIMTEDGVGIVKSVKKMPYKFSMYDISVDSDDHRFYSNGFLSHNTTTISAFISWMIVFHIDRNILIVANKEKTAIEIVDKIINIFKGLPYFLKPGCDSFGKTGLKLDNGSKIISSATTNTASIGFTIHCVLLDEFAHIPDNIVNNFWRSVYPTLSSSKISQCIITSTPNGSTNKFYEIWSGAISGKNSFVPIRTDYWEVPEWNEEKQCYEQRDEKWAAKMRADFGEDEFAQEFELQFNKNSKMLMKGADLDFLSRLKRKYEHKTIYVDNQYLDDENLVWHPDFNPNEISSDDSFVFLVDLAEGNGDPDELIKTKKKTPDSNTISIFKLIPNSTSNMKKYSNDSCSIKDAFRYIQIGKFATNEKDEIYCARVCSALAYNLFRDNEYNNVRIMVEMNFNGKSFFEEFKRHQLYSYGTILRTYHTKPVPGERQKKKYGFKTTSNKEYYCNKGNKMISKRRIITTDETTYNQLQAFGYVRGKLGGIACHDDLSMPTFNHIPRMLDENTFVSWIEERFLYHTNPSKIYEINQLIQQWVMDNPEMSDSDFMSMYGLSDNNPAMMYGTSNNILSPYSEGTQMNTYSNDSQISPYSESFAMK